MRFTRERSALGTLALTTMLAVLSLGLVGVAGWPGTAAAQQDGKVKIALIAPLSGPWARQGALKKLGADMAVDEINAAGGIHALGGAKVELVVMDAGDSTEAAKNAAQRLVSQYPDLAGGVGAWLSSFTLAITEVTERANLPWLSLSYSDQITNRGYKYVFQTSPTAGVQATGALPTLVDMATKNTGKRPQTVALIQDNTAAPVAFTKPMREGGFQKLGLKLVVDEIFTPPLSDATALVQKIRSARPDLILLIMTALSDDKLMMEKINEFKMGQGRIPIIGNGAHLGSPELGRVVDAEVLEGMMFIVANWAVKGEDDLIQRFKKRTGEPWLTQDSVSTYGEVWLLKEAMEKAQSADRVKVGAALHGLVLTSGPAAGAFPGGVRFDETGKRMNGPLLIVQWQKGVPVTVYPPEQALAPIIWPKPR